MNILMVLILLVLSNMLTAQIVKKKAFDFYKLQIIALMERTNAVIRKHSPDHPVFHMRETHEKLPYDQDVEDEFEQITENL